MKLSVSNKIIILVIILMAVSATYIFPKYWGSSDKNAPLLTSKKESGEFTSKRILAIISDTKWREGHIQFDHLRLMGFNLTVVKASQYKPNMLENADVVMFDYAPDSVDIKDKDSIRDFVEKKGNNVIFISPVGLNDSWKKEKYPNTPFVNLNIKAIDTGAGLNISGQIIPTTQSSPRWIYQLNRFNSKNVTIWKNYYFVLSNRIQVPIAYIFGSPSGGHYIIYSGSHLTLLSPEIIQSLIYLDKSHFETIYTKDNIINNFTYLIRIDDVGDWVSKKMGREKIWDNMIEFDKTADNYGFGVNHLIILNNSQADDVLTYLREYKNGKWIAAHGWNHDKPDGLHPEFEIDNKTFQEDILRKSKERFYELFGYYPKYIATPWNAHRYNFSKNMTDDDYGSFTAFKKYGFFIYSLYAEQGDTYAPFIVDGVIVIQQIHFSRINNLAFDELIRGASDNGWIIENYGHYSDENILQDSKAKYDIVSRYNIWNPSPNEFAEFLHALSGLHIEWKIGENEAIIRLKADYATPAGFTLKLTDNNNTIDQVYIDNNKYNYFTDKKLVFPELSEGTHIAKIYFRT